jgi:protein farnesyltransferase subunit beta
MIHEDDGFPSETSLLQREIVEFIQNSYNQSKDSKLKKFKHEKFLSEPLFEGLNHWFVALDASKPWIIYWILNALDLLGIELSKEIQERCVII